jgi:hypothetical protein
MFTWARGDSKDADAVPPPDRRHAMLRWFAYKHLPEEMHRIATTFDAMAQWMVEVIPASDEATVAMRKLLESRDAAIRAATRGKEQAVE